MGDVTSKLAIDNDMIIESADANSHGIEIEFATDGGSLLDTPVARP